MKASQLAKFGSVSMERLGAAPIGTELSHIAQAGTEPREFGRRRMNLAQHDCLRWNPATATTCAGCGKVLVG